MITFLITPVKSKRDSFYFETPTQKLTFDVAETPILFDSLHQLKQIQSARRKTVCFESGRKPRAPRFLSPRRKSLCSLQTPMLSLRSAISRSTTCTPHIKKQKHTQQALAQAQASLSPVSDEDEDPLDALQFLQECDTFGLTPANLFNATISKLGEQQQHDEHIDNEQDEKETEVVKHQVSEIISSTKYNKQFSITMLITDSSPSQQKIKQYLIEDKNVDPRGINLIESCCCTLCKQRNWNLVDIRMEEQWQIQQFEFIFENMYNVQQICATQCKYVTNILLTNGIIQEENYMNAIETFNRQRMNYSARKKKRCLKKANTTIAKESSNLSNLANDRSIILQHLATWSSAEYVDGKQSPEYDDELQKTEFLPIVDKEDGCLFISSETLRGLMDGSLDTQLFDYFIIIDCRYEYEYLGGHISGAVNVSDKLLMKLLFKANMDISNIASQRIAWIFHCEYSKHRGPQTCKYFRKLDRELNEYRYPYVSYPHVYVLQDGYKSMWNKYKHSYWTLKEKLFTPYGYISMWNDVFDGRRFVCSQFRKNVWEKETKKQETKLCHKRN